MTCINNNYWCITVKEKSAAILGSNNVYLYTISHVQLLDFWSWFTQNAYQLHCNNYNAALLQKLDETIADWGLVWEIGPGVQKDNSLTISANGNKELTEKAINIINYAPALPDWEFYAFKQPKENWHLVHVDNKHIDASGWSYVLLEYPDSKTEILVRTDNLPPLVTITRELVVDLVLTNLLGEQRKIAALDFIEAVDAFEDDDKATELRFLPDHLAQIRNKI